MTEMLTAKDMQSLLQVDRSTIYRMAEAGRLPAIKVGKQWRFPNDLVQGWLNQQAAPQPVAPPQNSEAADPQPPQDELADLLPLQCVQLIQDTFAEALNIMLVVTDLDGNPVTEVSNPCGLFSAISKEPNTLQKCLESWRTLGHTIDLEPKFITSHLGLLCARGMIRLGTELRGMVVVGGIAPHNWPPTPEQLEAIAAEFEVTPELLAPHLDEVFYLDQAERARVLPFVQRIANIIAHIAAERNSFMGKLNAIAQLTR